MMEDFRVSDIVKATNGHLTKGDLHFSVKGFSTDSRTLEQDEFFVALVGERFDGHDFITQALARGAAGLVVMPDAGGKILSKKGSLSIRELPVGNIVVVEDTLQALGDIARFYRSQFEIPVVGITGSNGKTTTKDMMALVLLQKYSVLRNEGNYNNAIGVPLTLIKLSRTHEIAVTEMGTGAPGEMSRLVEIAQPDVAVVTNVGPTHLEFFGSVDAVAAEKGILAQAAGSAVLNADDPRVAKMRDAVGGRTVLFGLANQAFGKSLGRYSHTSVFAQAFSKSLKDVVADDIGQDQYGNPEFTLVTGSGSTRIHLPALGRHNVYNALAAASVGVLLDVGLDEIRKGLESYQGTPMRMQKVIVNGAMIINDTYNSNPVSLTAAVDSLAGMECGGKKIAVLGDMLELGERSDELHREAGRFIAELPIDMLMAVGDKSSRLAKAALNNGMSRDRVFICETNLQVAADLRSILGEDDIVLIKGSRGVKMEQILEELRK